LGSILGEWFAFILSSWCREAARNFLLNATFYCKNVNVKYIWSFF